MSSAVIRIEGLNRLRRTVKKAGADMTILKGLNKDAARVVERAAIPSTPRRSGRLVSSIRSTGTQKAGTVKAGRKSIPYGGVVHWGWPSRNIKAQPWLVDAAKRTEPAWIETYLEGINDILDNVEGK